MYCSIRDHKSGNFYNIAKKLWMYHNIYEFIPEIVS